MSRHVLCNCPAGFSADPERHAPDCPGRSGAGKPSTMTHQRFAELMGRGQLERKAGACPCGDEYPAHSYGAGFIAGSGMCENCDAAIPARDIAPRATDGVSAADAPFQARVLPWLLECFGEAIASDSMERNHRFLEEALELVQACDCTPDEAHKLVDYVFGRSVGERSQEVGGVMVTLAALCLAQGLDMHKAGETELSRITQPAMVELIREKQKAKPAMSPLPGVYRERTEAATAQRRPNPAHGAPKPKGHNPVA